MNLIRAGMQLAGISEVLKAIRKDCPLLSSKCEEFTKQNLLSYYILINTWLLLIKEYSDYGWLRVKDAIVREGLIALIKSAQDTSDELIHGLSVTSSLWRSIVNDLDRLRFRFAPSARTIGTDPLATQLAVLRYPKRFSCVGNDLIQKKSLEDFISVENRSKQLQRRELNSHIVSFVQYEASQYLNWDALINDIRKVLNDGCCEFTGGVGYDSRASLGSKLERVAASFPEYFIEPFGIKYSGAFISCEEPEIWGKEQFDTVRAVKVAAVPKSYKASRIIAMEDTVRQARARAIASVLDRYLPATVSIHDQEVNQKLAWYGSVTGELGTLDLSHASDCITKTLFLTVFPHAFTDLIAPFLGTHTEINGMRREMQQMSTAGNSLTFILESMIFDIICRSAKSLYEVFAESTMSNVTIDGRNYPIPSVYGDDLIVDTHAAEFTCEVLRALGFIINDAKSYFSGEYRESCGKEYWAGIDVSSIYYPRFPIEGTITERDIKLSNHSVRDSFLGVSVDTLASLVSLQQRLYHISYGAARFVYELIKEATPKMTTSLPGSGNGDCWEYESTGRLVGAPSINVDNGERSSTRVVGSVSVTRQLKYRPTTKYTLTKPLTDRQTRLLNVYRYRRWLEYGPCYTDPLFKLLGIPDAPITEEQAFGIPTIIWSPKESID